ncbi:probable type I restriction-modification system,M subunit [Sorangium cellulosum So ce56]|uniref:site-specific DNA-methyltransferase (adenine-specific) n=1 Tax=Sorangium cellulosum (strain So ce56) TaxID=448385 RepID=A9FYU4_SORC5|nr:N-6 DNA methylase [Sorangium cellulosum]CAN98679.1 probable type I restriction-modification system,M subunit [Sorangium cellulosum So ce56]
MAPPPRLGIDDNPLLSLRFLNLLLHGIGPSADEGQPPIETRDSLAADPGARYSMVLTNPPFGKKSSVMVLTQEGDESREALTVMREDFWATTSNKQLNFVQHVKTILAIHGRAAVVVPDNVLFEGGAGETIRRKLLHDCDVHTLLRLPTGIFYAQGVKANVLFFDKKPASEKPWTRKLCSLCDRSRPLSYPAAVAVLHRQRECAWGAWRHGLRTGLGVEVDAGERAIAAPRGLHLSHAWLVGFNGAAACAAEGGRLEEREASGQVGPYRRAPRQGRLISASRGVTLPGQSRIDKRVHPWNPARTTISMLPLSSTSLGHRTRRTHPCTKSASRWCAPKVRSRHARAPSNTAVRTKRASAMF